MAKFFNNFRESPSLTELKIHKLTKINGKTAWKNQYCKTSILHKSRSNPIPIKIPMACFKGVGKKKILKSIWSQSNPEIEQQSRGPHAL